MVGSLTLFGLDILCVVGSAVADGGPLCSALL